MAEVAVARSLEDVEMHDAANLVQGLIHVLTRSNIRDDKRTGLALLMLGTEILLDEGVAVDELRPRLERVVERLQRAPNPVR